MARFLHLARTLRMSYKERMSELKMTVLDNGLRVITDQVDGIHSTALGVWVGVGTRDENMAHNGVAHMVEHMMFKGTEKRNSAQIVEEIENVGGHMNAYTSREVTSYHMHLLQDDAPLALDVLADMVINSTMPEDEIERERHVILQEIGMCHDTPDDLVFDKYYETAYPGQTLGAPILGTSDIIKGMQRDTMMDYVSQYYTPSRCVISASGAVDHDTFVAQAADLFGNMPADTVQSQVGADYKPGDCRIERELEQSHLIMGFRGISRLDDDFYTAQALSTLLGGGMSSRLFQEIREKRGLVYSIFSFHSSYSDDGQFGIYAGTGPDDLTELVPVVCDQVMELAGSMKEEEIVRTKAQLKASLLMGRESMMGRADSHAKFMLLRNKLLDVEDIIAKVDAIDMAGLQRVATRIFSSAPTISALGPLSKLDSYDNIAARLKTPLAA